MLTLSFEHLNESYNREKNNILEKDYDNSYIITVNDVLKAHYLICEYFESETGETSLYGIKNYNLLSSAVARQSVSIGNTFKYITPVEKAATVFYGLVKNHAFHDGNKRTALLSLLYFLLKVNRMPCVEQKEFEKLTERIASDNYEEYKEWKDFCKKKDAKSVDTKVDFIAHRINRYTNKRNDTYRSITYRELDTMLHQYNFYLEPTGTQEINLYYKRKNWLGKTIIEKLCQVGFKGWSRQIYLKTLKTIITEINKKIEIDLNTIYNGGDPMFKLIDDFAGPLSRLRDK